MAPASSAPRRTPPVDVDGSASGVEPGGGGRRPPGTGTARGQRIRPDAPMGGDDVAQPLVGVHVWPIGLDEESYSRLRNILLAFGGTMAEAAETATHVIIPDHFDRTQKKQLADSIGRFMRGNPKIYVVSHTWMEVVASQGLSAWDIELIVKHTPHFVMEMVVAELDKVELRDEPSTNGKRRRGACHDTPSALGDGASSSLRPRLAGRTPAGGGGGGGRAGGGSAASGQGASATRHTHMANSLQETLEFLKREYPEDVEAGQLRLAVQRSLLDCALQVSGGGGDTGGGEPADAPEAVLGVEKGAALGEVRAAYREKVLAAHPDKGGNNAAFCRVQRAYLSLTESRSAAALGKRSSPAALPASTAAASESKDVQLQEHKALVFDLFTAAGVDLSQCVARQVTALRRLGLEACDVGSTNSNERGQTIHNQCFYLSLAKSYLGDGHSMRDLRETALSLKRVIEAAVLEAHPEWGGQQVGEDVQAFSDFLFFVLGTSVLLSEMAVAIFDAVSGGVEVYVGRAFPSPGREAERRANTLTVRYMPGHYQALVAKVGADRPALDELCMCFEAEGVRYVTTDV